MAATIQPSKITNFFLNTLDNYVRIQDQLAMENWFWHAPSVSSSNGWASSFTFARNETIPWGRRKCRSCARPSFRWQAACAPWFQSGRVRHGVRELYTTALLIFWWVSFLENHELTLIIIIIYYHVYMYQNLVLKHCFRLKPFN